MLFRVEPLPRVWLLQTSVPCLLLSTFLSETKGRVRMFKCAVVMSHRSLTRHPPHEIPSKQQAPVLAQESPEAPLGAPQGFPRGLRGGPGGTPGLAGDSPRGSTSV